MSTRGKRRHEKHFGPVLTKRDFLTEERLVMEGGLSHMEVDYEALGRKVDNWLATRYIGTDASQYLLPYEGESEEPTL